MEEAWRTNPGAVAPGYGASSREPPSEVLEPRNAGAGHPERVPRYPEGEMSGEYLAPLPGGRLSKSVGTASSQGTALTLGLSAHLAAFKGVELTRETVRV